MQSWRQHLCLLALFAVAIADEWDYHENGPSVWGEHYPTCNGNQQSPIMLNLEDATKSTVWQRRVEEIDIQLKDYDTVATSVFTNNGHTVNLDFNFTNIETHPRVVIQSSSATGTFFLKALHFHWQSEHWVDHDSFPLEMHMVHKDSTGEQILVIGYVFLPCGRHRLGQVLSGHSLSGMDEVASYVQRLAEVGDSLSIPDFAPHRVMPYNLRACGYFAYKGSLTTPPCSEGVTWLVREIPLCVEKQHLQAFYRVHDAHGASMAGNARPLQPLNNRTVLFLTC